MKLIDPIDSAGMRGALQQAIADRKSMFEARQRGNKFGRCVIRLISDAVEQEQTAVLK